MMKLKNILISFSLIIVVSLIALSPTFSLNLLGDDWLAFFRYFQHLGPESPGQWNHLSYFLTPYGAQDIMMGFLQKTFDYNSGWYYFTSYLLRMAAAFSFYPLVYYLTKSKIAAFFAVLFFSITVIGFDTTNWSSNMTSYITVALLNLFMFFFFKSRTLGSFKFYAIAAVLFYLAYVTTPIRMHGSLAFIFLLELFWVLQKRNVKALKTAGLRFLILIVIFLVIRLTGQSMGPPQEPMERFLLGLKQDMQMLSVGKFDFAFYPILMFGSMLIPDFIGPSGQVIAIRQILTVIFFTTIVFAGFVYFISKNIPKYNPRSFISLLAALGIWAILVILIYKGNQNYLNNKNHIFSLLIGGFAIIFTASLIIKNFKENISHPLFLGIIWSILSFFFAWWWAPTSIFPTTYRYFVVSAMGITILLSAIIALGKERKQQISLFAGVGLILFIQFVSLRIYINSLLNSHSQEANKKIWSAIPKVEEIGKSKNPIIFYFEGDGTNGAVLHDVLTFGFPPRMAIFYNLREEDGGIPVPLDDFRQVISAATDGKIMAAHGYPVQPIPIERIYAFHLQGRDNLINVTDQARKQLEQIKLKFQTPNP